MTTTSQAQLRGAAEHVMRLGPLAVTDETELGPTAVGAMPAVVLAATRLPLPTPPSLSRRPSREHAAVGKGGRTPREPAAVVRAVPDLLAERGADKPL